MNDIRVKTIPHNKQIYPTCGNYWDSDDTIEFRISSMKDWRYEMLVLVHELIEYALVKDKGIKIEDIDKFDKHFEMEKSFGRHEIFDEPGNDKNAPYYKQHQFATEIEKKLAKQLKVNWKKYEEAINSL